MLIGLFAVLLISPLAHSQVASAIRSVTTLPTVCNGGTASRATDAVILVSGGVGTLYWCSAPNTWTSGTGTSPGGNPLQIQYNHSSSFGGFTLGGDCTLVINGVLSTGTITCLDSNGVPFGSAAFLNNATQTIASGSVSLGTSAISSGACAATQSLTASGVLTSDVLTASFNSDPTGTVGYQPLTSGTLTIFIFPTSGHVNFRICNMTAAPVSPGSVTLNYRVSR